MNEYRHGAHSVFEIHLHLVWVTKYRKPVLVGPAGHRVRDLIREICGGMGTSIPPQVTISRLVQRLKGKTAYRMLQELAPLRRQFWGRHLWARGYFCCSSGNVTDQVVAESIANQGKPGPGDFRVEGDDLEPA
jgi:putative transposase